MAFLTMTCKEVGLRIQSYLDGELDEARLEGIRSHLAACFDCGLEADTFRAIKEQLADSSGPTDPAVLDRLRRFSERISDQAPAG